jgi:hypothetical protein
VSRGWLQNAAAGQGGPSLDLPDGGVAPEVAITLQDGGYDPMAAFVGAELFPSFDSSLYGEGAGAEGASLTVAADISELFGSRWTGEQERGGDAALERRFRCADGGRKAPFRADGNQATAALVALPACLLVRAAPQPCLPPHPPPHTHLPPTHGSTELERLRSQGVEAPRDRADMFFGGGDEVFSPGEAPSAWPGLRGRLSATREAARVGGWREWAMPAQHATPHPAPAPVPSPCSALIHAPPPLCRPCSRAD